MMDNPANPGKRFVVVNKARRQLQRIGPRPLLFLHYVVHHVWRHWNRRRLRKTYSRTIARPPRGAELRPLTIDLPRAEELPEQLVPAAQRLYAEAEEVFEHRVDLLGSGFVSLGRKIDWQRDFKSGFRWPSCFYQNLTVTRLDDSSDAKVPWELSRGHHLLTLARAARLYEEERFARELEDQLNDWLAANPTGFGINWVNPMEIAIRAVNWVWAIGTLELWRPLDAELRASLTESLQAHARHIAANLEGTPLLRSNHYLSDILGLLVLGSALDGDRASIRWVRSAHAGLEREIRRQVYPDGVGFEGSLSYHALALEIFLLAKFTADRIGRPFSHGYEEQLVRMLEVARAVRHPNGRLPQFGDSDSGRILPAGFGRPPTLDHLLWLATTILDEEPPPSGDGHEEVAWTLGLTAWRRASELPRPQGAVSVAFAKGGIYVLNGGGTHVVVRCGDVGQNRRGGHAHNDLFSYELSFDLPVVVDSGTYVYTSDSRARNAFRSTSAHNAVRVADAEINPIVADELFSLRQIARPSVELWDAGPEGIRLIASHDGYRRLDVPVNHRRTFVLHLDTGELAVLDELLGEGVTWADSFVHLSPETDVNLVRAAEFELVTDRRIRLSFFGVDEAELTEGYISERYGVREQAPLVIARASGELPLRFGYRISAITPPA